jgi:hypothetical protein
MRNAIDLKSLHGKQVLVRSTRDIRTPPVALRGTIEVLETPEGGPIVSIAVEFPQMFTAPAHRRNIALSEEDVAQLVATQRRGTFEFTINDELM